MEDARTLLIYSRKEKKIKAITIDQFEKIFSVTYLNHLQFADETIRQKIQRKVEKKMQKQTIKQTNHWTLALLEKEWKKSSAPPVYIKWINTFVGYGIYATEDIPELTYIGEYAGVIKKRRKRKDRANDYIFGYVIGPSESRYVIDAEKRGNFVRFINHSDEPNLTSRWIVIDGISHIILFANRLIPKGTQLTYDYGPYYWKKRSPPILLN